MIKTFRLWDNLNKKWLLNFESVGGFNLLEEMMIFGMYQEAIDSYKTEYLQHLIITQSSGLFDMDGKEIYESDIMDSGYEVIFKDGCFFLDTTPLIICAAHRKVIGNYFQKELINPNIYVR